MKPLCHHCTLAGWLVLLCAVLCTACTVQDTPKPKAHKPKPAQRVHLVETAQVLQQQRAVKTVRSGTLRAYREVKIFNQAEGGIVSLPFYPGDSVAREELLVRLDDTVLTAELEKSVATRTQAEQDLARLQALRKQKLVAEDQLQRAQTALEVAQAETRLLQARFAYTKLRAPFAGIISERRAEPGDVIPRYTHIASLIDVSRLITEVSVSGPLLALLKQDDEVSMRIDALGEQEFAGRITRIHPTLDSNTRRGIIEVALSPVPQGAKPGQLARVSLNAREQLRRVIPFVALRRDNDGEYVYVVNAQNRAVRVNVRSGIRLEEEVEVLEGLNTNDRVITRGFLGLKDNKQVSVVESTQPAGKSG